MYISVGLCMAMCTSEALHLLAAGVVVVSCSVRVLEISQAL